MKRPRIKNRVGTSEVCKAEVLALRLLSKSEVAQMRFDVNQKYHE